MARFKLHFFAFAWPFLYFWRYLVPGFDGVIWRLGNDFDNLYFDYKAYLLSALSSGHLPLWSPSEGGGYPFVFSPFAQCLYPLNLILVPVILALKSYPSIAHQWFTVAGVGLFCLGVYLWLRSLKFDPLPALMAAMTSAITFKVAELIRFPNGIHTLAWLPFLLYCLTRIALDEIRPRFIVFFGFVQVCFLTAGYPYFYFYSFFLLVPYLVFLTSRKLRLLLAVDRTEPTKWNQLAKAFLAATIPALILVAPYFLKIARMLAGTAQREGRDFAQSTLISFDATQTLGSLIFPPMATYEGVYYFGLPALLLVIISLLFRFRPLHAFLLGLSALFVNITYAQTSAIFSFLWHHFPGLSSLRVWPRMNILLVILFAWILADSIQGMLSVKPSVSKGSWRWKRIASVFAFVGLYFAILHKQFYFLLLPKYGHYWEEYIKGAYSNPSVVLHPLVFGILGFFAILVIIRAIDSPQVSRNRVGSLVGLVLVLNVFDLSVTGRKLWAYDKEVSSFKLERFFSYFHGNPPAKPTPSAKKAAPAAPQAAQAPAQSEPEILHSGNFGKIMTQSLHTPRVDAYTTIQRNARFSVGTVGNWYYNRYWSFLALAEKEPALRPKILGLKDGRRFFCTRSMDHPTLEKFFSEEIDCNNQFDIVQYDGDTLSLSTRFAKDVYFHFIDNWDPDWKAYLDEVEVPILVSLQTFKAVRVPPGEHRLRFRYGPFDWTRALQAKFPAVGTTSLNP